MENNFTASPTASDIEDFLLEQDIASLTKKLYRRLLLLFINEISGIPNLSHSNLRKWLYSQTKWGDSMRWLAFCVSKKFLIWKYGDRHPALSLKITRKESPPQRTLRERSAAQLFEYFFGLPKSPKSIRDLAIASLLLDTGLRASEICRLEIINLDLEKRHLAAIVKGNKWGEAVFSKNTAIYMKDWLAERKKIANPTIGTIFVGIGGHTPGEPITRQGLLIIVKKWGIRAGIGPLSPHDFRRGFATISTLAGAPERVAMRAGRWESVSVFARYVQAIRPDDFEPYFPVPSVIKK